MLYDKGYVDYKDSTEKKTLLNEKATTLDPPATGEQL